MAKVSDYEELRKTVKRKKLSLKRKSHHVDLTNELDDHDDSRQLDKIKETIAKVQALCNG